MRRSFIAFIMASCSLLTAGAQNTCADLTEKESGFTREMKAFAALKTAPASARSAFAASYRQYKEFFAGMVGATDGTLRSMAAYVGLKAVTAYCYYGLQGKDNELLQEAQWALDTFLPFIDLGDDYKIRCNTSSTSAATLTRDEYRNIGSGLISYACMAAFRLGHINTAMEFFMKGHYYMNGFASIPDVFLATGEILGNRLHQGLMDDTTFIAAYFHLKSSSELKTVTDISMSFGRSFKPEALTVITDARFLKYKTPETKHGLYYYYPYASYFQDLYAYLAEDSSQSNQYLQQGVLKMLLKTWQANGKKGLDFIHFSQQLDRYAEQATQQIIVSGDKELMEMVADFISKDFNSDKYDQLNYNAYLLYNALGLDKKSGKVYKRISKDRRQYYPAVAIEH
jgi:hypothetical protein